MTGGVGYKRSVSGYLPSFYSLQVFVYSYLMVKPVKFRGDALDALRRFPDSARQDAGFQLDKAQRGRDPDDWKPMRSIGLGVKEIRIRDVTGAFRVIYLATLADAVYVLYCFHKKSEQTGNKDIQLARKRYKDLMGEQM